MNIAAFSARNAADAERQAMHYRAEARADRNRADQSLRWGDREGQARWLRQAARCDQWAAESEEAAEQFRALADRAEVIA